MWVHIGGIRVQLSGNTAGGDWGTISASYLHLQSIYKQYAYKLSVLLSTYGWLSEGLCKSYRSVLWRWGCCWKGSEWQLLGEIRKKILRWEGGRWKGEIYSKQTFTLYREKREIGEEGI